MVAEIIYIHVCQHIRGGYMRGSRGGGQGVQTPPPSEKSQKYRFS